MASLAMSSPRDASGDFPLHLLVWNNDYRQLEKELRDQVRGRGEGLTPARGAGESGIVTPPRAHLQPSGERDGALPSPSAQQSRDNNNNSRMCTEYLMCARPCVEGFIYTPS